MCFLDTVCPRYRWSSSTSAAVRFLRELNCPSLSTSRSSAACFPAILAAVTIEYKRANDYVIITKY